jgi:hypothetical protein
MNFKRDTKSFEAYIEFLKANKKSFTIRHGTYTTFIETQYGKNKYETAKFDNRVFIAANMIKRDVKNSQKGQEIMQRYHSKVNFGHRQDIKPFTAERVLNIDISSAYATCLLNSGLITQETFEYVKRLRKEERLPAVGMLARSACYWEYERGECTGIHVDRAETAEVFFYLIEEINLLMKSIEWELGRYFYFYWVDGVFFDYDTPRALVAKVEAILIEAGYRYKYESVSDFRLTKDKREVFRVDMIKNGEQKQYQFSTRNEGRDITAYLANAGKVKHTNFHKPKAAEK